MSAEQPDAEHILSHDVGTVVLDTLSLSELSALAKVQPRLMPTVSALEERWLRGCFELCSGTLEWMPSDPDGTHFSESNAAGGWMAAWHTIHSLRTEFITRTLNSGKALPDTLTWGEETWTRLPHEEALSEAFADAMLYHPSAIEGCGDDQCDTYPVGVGFYRRPPADTAPPEGAIGHLGSVTVGVDGVHANLRRAITGIRRAIDPGGCDDQVFNDEPVRAVMEPVSLVSLLETAPSCMGKKPPRGRQSPRGRRLEQAIAGAIATCAPFVALCVGEAAPLTAAHALEVLEGTRRHIVEGDLEWARDNEWDVPIAHESIYDEDDDDEYEDHEACLTTFGLDRVEAALKAQVAAVAAKHGVADTHGRLAAFAAAPCGLAWDAELANCVAASPETALAEATKARLQELRAALAAPMAAQARALHAERDAPLDARPSTRSC